jgi:hypothetical protein
MSAPVSEIRSEDRLPFLIKSVYSASRMVNYFGGQLLKVLSSAIFVIGMPMSPAHGVDARGTGSPKRMRVISLLRSPALSGIVSTLSYFAIFSSACAEALPPANLAHPPEIVTAEQLAALAPHPRLLVDAARWKELAWQVKSDPATAEIFGCLKKRAELMLELPPVDYDADPHNILEAVREAQRRILTFAIVYRLTEDRAWLEAARHSMKGLVAQPWPRGHFLDTAEATFALSAGFDWLYDQLAPEEREGIIEKIHHEALLASVTEEEKMEWIWADHNWNQVCHGGLVIGALAIVERDPELAKRIINRSLANLPRAATAYSPDGVYPEGPSYWGFGTTYHLLQTEALRITLNTTEGIEKFPGFLESAACLDFLTGPSGQFFNYADNFSKRSYSAAALWFARENQRPDLALTELGLVRKFASKIEADDTRELPLFLLWWRPLPDPVPIFGAAPLNWRGESSQPVAVLRSAWNDPLTSWVAIKGGSANQSHAHMDAGSFVFETLGVRWAIDPVRDDYSFLRRAGYKQEDIFNYSQESKRWAVFRLGPEGHNILRFGTAPQTASGHARVSPIHDSAAGVSVNIDLTPSYEGQAASVLRTATLCHDASLMLADTWMTLDKPVEVTWQWLTRASVTRTEAGFILRQNGRTLHLRIDEGDKSCIEVQEAATLLHPSIDNPLPDVRRIVIKVTTRANSKGSLKITALPEAAP